MAIPARPAGDRLARLYAAINGPWHKRALIVFLAIVMGHWMEHLAQAFQLWVLHWPIERARGLLGMPVPWLVKTEFLHWALNLVILTGLVVLLPGFTGRARTVWKAALVLQTWHFFEHMLLFSQFLLGKNLLGKPVPTSIVQLWIPRVDLHLFYNGIVTVPIVLAAYLQYRRRGESAAVPV